MPFLAMSKKDIIKEIFAENIAFLNPVQITIITIFTEPCEAGKRLDPSTGCQDCPADHWSAAANIANTCAACPAGKEVGAGLGKQESDCTWS